MKFESVRLRIFEYEEVKRRTSQSASYAAEPRCRSLAGLAIGDEMFDMADEICIFCRGIDNTELEGQPPDMGNL